MFFEYKGHIMSSSTPISREWFEAMTGKDHLIQRLFTVFVREEPARVKEIHEALEQKDYERLKHLVHSLKGACVTMGACTVRDQCVKMEKAAKARKNEELEKHFKGLDTEMGNVFEFMDNYLENS